MLLVNGPKQFSRVKFEVAIIPKRETTDNQHRLVDMIGTGILPCAD